MDLKYMDIVIKEANKSLKYDDVPVGTVLVYDGKVIAKAHNTRNKDFGTLSHAEISCLQIANKKKRDWRLFDCDMYVSLEPCDMCKSIINESRIRNVYYLINRRQEKKQYSKTSYNCVNDECINLANEYVNKLNNFFQKMR